MGFPIYLSLTGQNQGNISAGCGSADSVGHRCQFNHTNQILVHEVNYGIRMVDNKSLMPFSIRKPVDKASPLLFQAVNDNEVLNCEFDFYRIYTSGTLAIFYKIKLKKARITNINTVHPHAIYNTNGEPEEIVFFQFDTITLEHVTAKTSGWAAWKNES